MGLAIALFALWASSDLPGMLLTAREYIKANKPGRAEVWILSDIRANDWNAEGGRWQTLRDGFQEFAQGVRFHLLAYPQTSTGNLAVRVTDARRQKTGENAELLVSLKITREGKPDDAVKQSVPIQFEVGGARSEVTVEMTGPQYELKEHRIPLGAGNDRGWGKVTIPADAEPADNAFYFAFSQPSPRLTIVVAEDPQAAQPLQLASAISPDPTVSTTAEAVAPEALGTVEWEKVALVLWQAPLPSGDAAKLVKAFIDRGGYVVFFPPRNPTGAEFLGTSWTSWTESPQEIPVETWRGDQDVLANTLSGTALPVGKLSVRKYCGMRGESTPLASLKGGAVLLSRATTTRGGAYFCATTPAPSDSSLAIEGVVFYVIVQRALAGGATVLQTWKRLAGADDVVSTDYPSQAGVYQSGERLLAVNRPAAEDNAAVLADARVAGLFKGLDFSRVDDQAGSLGSLIQEIWRIFLACMMVAMMVEAGLCLPRKPVAEGASSSSRIPAGAAS